MFRYSSVDCMIKSLLAQCSVRLYHATGSCCVVLKLDDLVFLLIFYIIMKRRNLAR